MGATGGDASETGAIFNRGLKSGNDEVFRNKTASSGFLRTIKLTVLGEDFLFHHFLVVWHLEIHFNPVNFQNKGLIERKAHNIWQSILYRIVYIVYYSLEWYVCALMMT